VLVQGVPQDPQKFLAVGQNLPATQFAKANAPAAMPVAGHR
jgi:hypothetical protein